MAFLAQATSAQSSAPLRSDAPSLSRLLDQARQLQGDAVASPAALPAVALGLDQIESQSRALAARAQHEIAGQSDGLHARDLKAQYLLSGAAVNADAVSHTLDRLDPASAFVQLQPVRDNDVEGLLRHAHEASIVHVIEESRKAVLADFYDALRMDVHAAWEQQKEAIFDEIGRSGASALRRPENGHRNLPPEPMSSPISAHTSPLQARMLRYERVLGEVNEARKASQPYDIIDRLAAVDSEQADVRRGVMPTLWRLIAHLVRERGGAEPGIRYPAVRQFATAYASAHDAAEAIDLRRHLAQGALGYLEEYFFSNVIERELTDNPHQAHLGGIPSIINKVVAYVRLRRQKQVWPELENIAGEPLWAHIFFLLRSGHPTQAEQYAREHEDALAGSGAPDFAAYFSRWLASPHRKLSRSAQEAVSSYYYARIRHNPSCDPFKLALYKLMARADLSKKRIAAVTDRTEDWFWLQLSLAREGPEQSAADRWSLLDLSRDMVTRYSSEAFGPAYVQLLLLCGQFERAIAHMYRTTAQQTEALHLAVALSYYGLLRLPRTAEASAVDILTICDEDETSCALDYVRILMRHCRGFARASPVAALQYICLIPLAGAGTSLERQQVELCQQKVMELVLETDAYAALLGDVGRDGAVAPGAIAQVSSLLVTSGSSPAAYVRSLTRQVAHRAEADKRFATTVLLYYLADEHDNVMRTLNSELGMTLARPGGAQQSSQQPVEGSLANLAAQDPVAAARAMLQYYRQGRGTRSGPSVDTLDNCEALLKMHTAFDAFEQGEWETALQAVTATSLIPLGTADITAVMRKAEDIKTVDDALSQNLGRILLLTMETLYRLHAHLKDSPWADSGRQAKMNEYRLQARSLMMFAGMLRFRLTGNVYEQLSRLDCFL